MIFKDPWVLLAVPFIFLALVIVRRKQRRASIFFPAEGLFGSLPRTWKRHVVDLPRILRMVAIFLFGVALAGPRTILDETKYTSEGIDIVLAIDASRSMAAMDFTLNGRPANRLKVIKGVVEEFLKARESDRISIVAFGGLAYTVSPLTHDYHWLTDNLRRLDFLQVEDGTAIGSALATSMNRLRKSSAKSKVIVLLTDGMNNTGRIAPLQAAQAAKALGIRVYTIGAGTKGYSPYPVQDLFGNTVYKQIKVEIDEETLQEIARITGGKYFRATDTQSLRQIYQEIDHLEKTPQEEKGYREYRELFSLFLTIALLCLAVEFLLNHTLLLRIP